MSHLDRVMLYKRIFDSDLAVNFYNYRVGASSFSVVDLRGRV